MIHYLSRDLTISGHDTQTIALERASAKKSTPLPISFTSASVTVDSHLSTSSDPPPSYTTYPEEYRVVSPYSDSLSNSSRESSPLSLGPKTPHDEDSSARLTPEGKPVHIDFINTLSDIKMKHDEIHIHDERERTWGWARGVGGNIQNERTPSSLFLFRSSVARPTIDW
jgi:hypothetical protein